MVSFGIECSGGLFAEVIINISIVKIKNEVFDLFQVKEELLWKLPLLRYYCFRRIGSNTNLSEIQGIAKRERKLFRGTAAD